MRKSNSTNIYTFDCDGVVLDSNRIKLEAMRRSLEACDFPNKTVQSCLDFFRKNFGISRYLHITHFIDNILDIEHKNKKKVSEKLLANFSERVSLQYMQANFCDGIQDFLRDNKNHCNIVSGSDQIELIDVLKKKGVISRFDYVLGSPTTKIDNLINLKKYYPDDAVHYYFGDALGDYEAAKSAGYLFFGVLGYSLVSNDLEDKCIANGCEYVNSFKEIL
jgi:phosphoglycolate phosphatase-like HAD superfamily hydrolase